MQTVSTNNRNESQEDFFNAFLEYAAQQGITVHEDDTEVVRFDGDTLILRFTGERVKISRLRLEGAHWVDAPAGRFWIR